MLAWVGACCSVLEPGVVCARGELETNIVATTAKSKRRMYLNVGATLTEVVVKFPTSAAGTRVGTASGSDRIGRSLEFSRFVLNPRKLRFRKLEA